MNTAEHIRFVIKICGITNERDAEAALDAGANALGFNFYSRSPRHITPARARDIVRALSGEFLTVGVFVNADPEELLAIAEQVPLDVLQLHGKPCELARLAGRRIWKAIAPHHRPTEDARIEAYLLDTVTPSYGGSGQTFDWDLAAKFPYRAVIAGGLDASNVAKAIETSLPWGVDACSRLESSPGKKDPDRIREFVQAALVAMGLQWPPHRCPIKRHRAAQEVEL